MSLMDWLIVVLPVAGVFYMGYYSRRYIRSVADFLAAGRICGRYTICVADVATGISVLGIIAFVEVHYKTGFAVPFWNSIITPLGIVLSLSGYCLYRWRETKAMSLGQFLEMRYSRKFRIFASALRSLSELLANTICPALAARFFIYFLDFPNTINILGLQIPTFILLVALILTMAISIICMGGTLALTITDTIQGLVFYPLLVIFCVFVAVKFSWFDEIVPVMMDRIPGESFLNPYDIYEMRDFNIFALVVTIMGTILHRASWIGAGNSSAAKSPHEQKMAAILGSWRTGFSSVFFVLMAVMIITIMNHSNFAPEAKEIRTTISERISRELLDDPAQRQQLQSAIETIPEQRHVIGKDPRLSQTKNLDTIYLDTALKQLTAMESPDNQGESKLKFQQYRTLFHQLMLPVTMSHILPNGLLGLFCMFMILAMVSTDDTQIYSAALTIAQDVVMPLRKTPLSPEKHIRLLRWVSIGCGIFFFIGSIFMAQLDYINLFVTIMCSMWMGGCGPVMIFGLYSRFGTTAGAWASLLSGMFLSLGGIFIQRNWADIVYPWLAKHNLAEPIGRLLETLSGPFEPYIRWRMDAIKFPINSYEIYFFTMVISLILYVVVSKLTCREPFNLDRMLHRGIYNTDGENKAQEKWTFRNIFSKMVGITPEYTKGDRILAWSVFVYSFIYRFVLAFLMVVIWNLVTPWPMKWWGHYFLIVSLIIPAIIAAVSTVWFTIGGIIDLRQMFIDLRARIINPLDDGRVEGHTSLADKALFEAKEKEQAGRKE